MHAGFVDIIQIKQKYEIPVPVAAGIWFNSKYKWLKTSKQAKQNPCCLDFGFLVQSEYTKKKKPNGHF